MAFVRVRNKTTGQESVVDSEWLARWPNDFTVIAPVDPPVTPPDPPWQSAVSDAKAAAASAAASWRAAEAAAASAVRSVSFDQTDPDILLITTTPDGNIVVDPADADALIITT